MRRKQTKPGAPWSTTSGSSRKSASGSQAWIMAEKCWFCGSTFLSRASGCRFHPSRPVTRIATGILRNLHWGTSSWATSPPVTTQKTASNAQRAGHSDSGGPDQSRIPGGVQERERDPRRHHQGHVAGGGDSIRWGSTLPRRGFPGIDRSSILESLGDVG